MNASLSNTYPESYRKQIYAAICTLAGQCDGAVRRDTVGYNGADTKIGHKLAAIPADKWYPNSWVRAWKLIQKYGRQLAAYGIDPKAIPEPPMAGAVAPKATRTIIWKDGSYRISLNGLGQQFNAAKNDIKAIPIHRYIAEQQIWEVPAMYGPEVIHFAVQYGYEIRKA